jgi:NTE family protein
VAGRVLAATLAAMAGSFGIDLPTRAAPCPEDRPCVALVLAGGGARGAAHVGVLEVMEELRVPVDFIVGTSMGAIVGGMYASGYSPAELREKLEEIDWQEAFNDDPPRRNIPFRSKEMDDRALFKLEFGFSKSGFRSPAGLIAGHKLDFILSSLLVQHSEPQHFDDLPIPYRAIAVDLTTGEMVVLEQGQLVTAIRASMAYPVMFTPVEQDGRQLVDGGVLRNLPVDVAIEMGADRLIAVDVGSPLGETKGAGSAFAMARRTISVMSHQGRDVQRELIREQDLLITPELEGIRAFESFGRVGEVMDEGIETARAHADELQSFAVSEESFARFLERQRAGTRQESFVVDRVEVSGLQRVSPKRVTRRLVSQPGQTLDLEVIRHDLERVYRIGEFERVGFALEDEGDKEVLKIDVHEKSWGPWFYRLGAAIQANFSGEGGFTGNVFLRRPNLNPLGAEWRSFFTVGNLDSVSSELYQPFEFSGTFFVAPRVWMSQNGDESLFVAGEEILLEAERRSVGLDLGIRIRNDGELRVGATTGRVDGTPLSGPFLPQEADTGGWRTRLSVDRLDNGNFPRDGTSLDVELFLSRKDLNASAEYDRLWVKLGHVWKIGKWSQAAFVTGGTNLSSDTLPYYDDFALGGFLNLSGLEQNELTGDESALVVLAPYRKFASLPSMFGGDLYLGGSLEAGQTWRGTSPSFDDLQIAGSLWAGVDTLFGPFYLAYGRTENDVDSWYLFLGRIFGSARPETVERFGR